MQVCELVEKYGEGLIGRYVKTPAMGRYPGGVAVVYALDLDPNAPEIVLNVVLPGWGVMGVFDGEEVELVDKALSTSTAEEMTVYKTTSARWNEDVWYRDPDFAADDHVVHPENIPDPVDPEADSRVAAYKWELVGTAATMNRLFWTWKRRERV